MAHFILFAAVSIWDLILTQNGLRYGFIMEINPIIIILAQLFGISIFISIVLCKILSLGLAFLFLFKINLFLCDRPYGIIGKFVFIEKNRQIIILTAVLANFIFGVIPGLIYNIKFFLSQ